MFVFSVKSPKTKVLAAVLILLALCLGYIVISQLDFGDKGGSRGTTVPEEVNIEADAAISYNAADESERMQFIAQFGWTVRSEPEEIAEIIIPSAFDDVYEKYNSIQKNQGLDLESYKGERVKRWSYAVTNYPNAENSNSIRINLLIYKGVVIGGDICDLGENGFMHGFAKE